MEIVIKLSAVAVAGAALTLLLKKDSPGISMLLAVCVTAAVLVFAFGAAEKAVEFIRSLADTAGVSPESVSIVMKTVAIAAVTRITADVCADAGHRSIASAVELGGACTAFYTAIPLMKAALEMIGAFL